MLNLFKKKAEDVILYAPVNGDGVALDKVNDKMFADKVLGDGIAVIPKEEVIYAPCNGVISMVAVTKHAFGITADNGAEILVHIGFDTVSLNGEGFQIYVKQGQKVKANDQVLKVDISLMKEKQIDMTIPVVVTNSSEYEIIKIKEMGSVTKEMQMVKIRKK